jgi:hypothetical protein
LKLTRCGLTIAVVGHEPSSMKTTGSGAGQDPILSYRMSVLQSGAALDPPGLDALRARIPESPIARALLRGREMSEEFLAHAYRKWQGPHWTLMCLAMIDYPPGDDSLRPLMRAVDAWLFSKRQLSPPNTAVYSG